MLSFLPAPVTGCIVFSLLVINLLCWAVPVYLLIFLKLLTWGRARIAVSRWVAATAQQWSHCNTIIWNGCLPIEWDYRGVETLDRNGQYLVVSNHQSWNDIFVQLEAFDRRAPFFKFFMKQQLIWVPVLGLAWWGLDFPFMKRHSAEQIKKNPALRGQDLETTRKACEKYRHMPVTILNFLEGTRFRPEKHARQQSPYQHLLKPKAGGFAFAIAAMGENLHCMLDITIVYPDGPNEFWDFVCGRVRRVVCEVREVEIPREFFHSDYNVDPEYRQQIKAWVEALWWEKDQRITEILAEVNAPAS